MRGPLDKGSFLMLVAIIFWLISIWIVLLKIYLEIS